MSVKKTNMFKKQKPAGPKRVRNPQSEAQQRAAQQIDDMTTEQQQAAEQYLQSTASLAKRLVDQGIVKRSPGTGIQQYIAAYAHIEETVAGVLDIMAKKFAKPNVAELAAVLSGLIGLVIAEASSRGVQKEVTEEMFVSLEKMFGAGVRLTTIEGQRVAQSRIIQPSRLN